MARKKGLLMAQPSTAQYDLVTSPYLMVSASAESTIQLSVGLLERTPDTVSANTKATMSAAFFVDSYALLVIKTRRMNNISI
ncbi:MAG: hypothetical protein WBI69_01115 [Limnochordia bacterium]